MQEKLNWKTVNNELLEKGFVKTSTILSPSTCQELINNYTNDIYRSTINMQRYNFGQGEYKYYSYPLPRIINDLRHYFYENLKPAAQEWSSRLKTDHHFPDTHEEYINTCHQQDQARPTPLILKYGKDDYTCLHQDLYGEIHFSYQAAIMLSDENDYRGGEFTLVEQRPRRQSVPT
jgi:hypothetical protein